MGYIYKIYNDINNKVYIGQTSKTVEDRFKEHIKQAKNGTPYHLYNAMRKYGIEHFFVEEIEQCDRNSLNKKEQY